MTRDSTEDFVEQFTEFYLGRYRNKIEEFAQGDAEEQSSLSLDWPALN